MRYGNFTAKDTFNAAAANILSELKEAIEVSGLEIDTKPNKDGEVIETATIKTTDGTLYSTISVSAIQQLYALAEMLEDGETDLKIEVVRRTSTQGNQYIQLQLV